MAAQIDRLEIEIEAQAQKANRQLDALATKLSKVSNALSGINTKNLGKIGNIGNANSMTGSLQNLSNSMSRFAAKTENARKSTRSLAATFGHFYASCFLLIRGFKALGKSISASMDYIETYNYYNVTMSKIASEFSNQWGRYGYENAEAYGDSFVGRLNELTQKMSGYKVGKDGVLSISGGQNLSLDPEQLMNYQASVAAITNSVGLVGETSVNTAKALSMLAADMSSLKNIDMSTVMTNFQSGLIGQSRALYKYGIDITNATLQTYAYKYGIETAMQEMTQADKMQLRLLAILDQSKIAWGDQANTLNSVANQYRILKQQISNLARIIGNLFIPVLQAVLPVVNGVVMALQRMFTFIGNLIGVDWSGIMDGISTGYGGADDIIGDLVDDTDDVVDSTDGIGGSLDSANDKAKKLQKTILGFDEINKLNDNSDIGSSGGSGISGSDIGGIGAGGIDLSDEIAKALADYESVWDKALKNSQNKAQEFADKICAAFDQIRKLAKPTTAAIKKLWDEGLSKLGKFSSDTLKDFWNNFLKPVGTWMLADDAGLPRFFNITNDLLNGIDWGRLRSSLAEFYTALQTLAKFSWTALMDFYEGFMKPMAVWAMSTAIPQLVDIMTAFINKVDWERINAALRNFWDALAPFAQNVGQGLINFFGKLMDIGAEFLNTVVPGGLNGLAEALKKISPEQAQSIGEALGKIALAVLAFKGIATIVTGISNFGIAIAGLATGLGAIFGAEGIFATIGAKIGAIATSISVFGSNIVEAFSLVTGGAGTLTEAFSAVFGISLPVVVAIGAVVAALVDLWNTSETFRDAVGQAFSMVKDAVTGAFEKVKEAISPLMEKFQELGAALYKFYEESGLKLLVELIATLAVKLAGIIASGVIEIFGNLLTGLAEIVGGVIDVLTGIVEIITGIGELNPETILSGIKQIGSGIAEVFDGIFTAFFEFGTNIIAGLLDGIIEGVKGIGSWLKEHVVDPIVNGFKSLFGIHSPSTVMAELGGFLMEGLLGGIKGLVEDVTGVFTGVRDTISGIWTNITEAASTAWEGISTTVGDVWEGLKTTASEKFLNIKESVIGAWDEIKETGGKTWDSIKKTVGGIWENLTTSAGDSFNGIKETVFAAWESAKEKTGEIWDGVKSTVGGIWDWLTGKSSEDFPAIQKNAEESWDNTENATDVAWANSEKYVKDSLHGMRSQATTYMKQIFNSVESYTNQIYEAIGNGWGAAGREIEDALAEMDRNVQITLSSISNSFAGLGNEISRSLGDLTWVGRNAAQEIANGFSSIHIPTPHISVTSSAWSNGGSYSYSMSSSVNWYKKGGFFDSPSVIGVGEDGSEAVVPFEHSPAMSKLAASIAKHMDGKELNTGRDLLQAQRNFRDTQADRMGKVQPFSMGDVTGAFKEVIQDAMMEVYMATNIGRSDDKPYVLHAELKTEDNEVLARAVEKGWLKRDTRLRPKPSF